ncbi:MAG TPA: ATP-dependent DNA helicase [Cryptosporangiaceae bacterium]|nr:ATP-dependent DNA helicase [Cryptosporangiaceae bacterium]
MATADVDELLAAAVRAVPGGVTRPGQVAMAHAVADAANAGEHLLVQAGTGTGKSLAYLVPALASGERAVVSTATIALQSQLVEHDLPRLVDAVEPVLGRRPTFALLKGRHNYLCLARLEAGTADEADALFDDGPQWLGAAGRLGQQVTRVREWATETDTGDRAELDPGVDDATWRQVSMPARECVGAQKCPYGEECYAEASRFRARQADIVVTNHSLLAADMLAGRHIVPEHALLVVDEAHELTDRVSSAAQAELTGDSVSRAARRLRSYVDVPVQEALEGAADGLAHALAAAPVGRLDGLPDALRDALVPLDAAGRSGLDSLGGISADDPEAVGRNQAKALLTVVVETAQRLLLQSGHDVAWVAEDDRLRRSLVVAPLSVAGALGTGLFRGRTVVATSATLALGGRFEVMARSLGLDPEHGRTPDTGDVRPDPVTVAASAVGAPATGVVTAGSASAGSASAAAGAASTSAAPPVGEGTSARWRAMDVGSPFEYPRQGILYVAARLPRPGASGLSEPAQAEFVSLVQAAGGRTLGLFSSRRAAGQAAEALRDATDLPVLLQGEDTLHHLVRRFREEPATCLLGVMSLWQGVDVPGDACQLVVIDRLPFPRPDEPLSSARAKAVDDAGGSGFMAVSVPMAAVRLAQGAGRLVRSASDRGVVAVLDSRLHSARYGDFIRRSLPPFWYTTSPDVVRAALARLREGAEARASGSREADAGGSADQPRGALTAG